MSTTIDAAAHEQHHNNHDANGNSHGVHKNDDANYSSGASLQPAHTAHGHVVETSQPAFPLDKIHRKLALPIPLGAYSIGATIWFLGLILVNARQVTLPNAWIINGLPMGFIATIMAGFGEFFCGSTFGCCLFLSVGGLILGLALPFLPWSSVGSSFGAANAGDLVATAEQINVATGIFLLVAWAILFVILIAAQRTAVAFVTSLIGINIALITFGVGLMTGNAKSIKAAGVFLILTALNLFYNGTALILLDTGHPLGRFFPLGSLAPAPPKEIA